MQTVCYQLFNFFSFVGHWDEGIWFYEQAEIGAIAQEDQENAGWQAYRTGFFYTSRAQPAEVLACAARATKHWQASIPRNKAWAIRLRGLGHYLNQDYPAAITACREVLEIFRSLSPESEDVAIVLNDMAVTEKSNKNHLAAERDFLEALRIARRVDYQEGIAYITGNLAELALNREQWVQAESLARESLALAEKIGRQELIAGNCNQTAKALFKQNRVNDEALALAQRAVEIFKRLCHRDLQEAQDILAEIERAMSKCSG